MKVKIHIDEKTLENLTPEALYKIQEAERRLNRMVNSDRYRDWCITYNRRVKVVTKRFLWWARKFHYENVFGFTNTKMTNEEVYRHLMSGKETLNPVEDGVADIYLKIDKKGARRVLGHTYPNSIYQWIHGWFLYEGDVDEVKGNLWHELCHKYGFKHERRYSLSRQQSVPYEHGYFARDF